MSLSGWAPRPLPIEAEMNGRFVRIVPLDLSTHSVDLFEATKSPVIWTYLPFEPFRDADDLAQRFCDQANKSGWLSYAICDIKTGKPLGMASYMRLRPEHGSIEIGCVVFGGSLRRSAAATEAMYLMARYVFEDLGYRRYEWKCHADNEASRRAALRLGFAFEGVFRQDMVFKGENRDTAWFSMIDRDWEHLAAAMKSWLQPENFDDKGRQLTRLKSHRRES